MSRRAQPIELERIRTLQGARLSLRPPRPADAPAVFAYASDPAATRYLAWPRHTSAADSERFLQRAIGGWQDGTSLVWMIEDEEGVAGSIGAALSGANAGIGYVLSRHCWGRGYATEALVVHAGNNVTLSRPTSLIGKARERRTSYSNSSECNTDDEACGPARREPR